MIVLLPWLVVSVLWFLCSVGRFAGSAVGLALMGLSVIAPMVTAILWRRVANPTRTIVSAMSVLLIGGPLTPFWTEGLFEWLGIPTNVDGTMIYVLIGPVLVLVGLVQIGFAWSRVLRNKPVMTS